MKNYFIALLTLWATIALAGNDPSNLHFNREPSNPLRGNGILFTQNLGQITDMENHIRPDILFKGGGAGTDIYLRKTGISYVLTDIGKVMHEIEEEVETLVKSGILPEKLQAEKRSELEQKARYKLQRIDVDFADGNPQAPFEAAEQADGYINYYFAHCPQGITNVLSYNQLTQKNVYPGIDVKYYGGKEYGLKYDIVVNPGADHRQIKLKYTGAEVRLENETLKVKTPLGNIMEYMPKVYQKINGKIVNVKAKYVITPISEAEVYIGFTFVSYDYTYPLIIDPYIWATYYGGSSTDFCTDMVTDRFGNAVITGYTWSANFPVAASIGNNIFQGVFGGGVLDAYVVKFDPMGVRLWSTYCGGSSRDLAYGIATDPSGNIAIVGSTGSVDFPIGASVGNSIFQGVMGGGGDAFVVKFDPTGGRLWASHYWGCIGSAITTDAWGNIAITGIANNTFPTGASIGNSVYQGIYGGGLYDAGVVKFNPTGGRLWASYFGGTNEDRAYGITTDFRGNVIFTGYTTSVNFPIGASIGNSFFQGVFGGGTTDAIVVKFDPTGGHLWSTYYGGGGGSGDYGYHIATDASGNIVFTGYTESLTFPVGASAGNSVFQGIYGGGSGDAFVVKFDPTGSRLWATFLGGDRYESMKSGHTCAIDNNGNIYVLSEWEDENNSGDFPMNTCALDITYGSGSGVGEKEDMFVTKFSSSGNRICSTYIGGKEEEDIDNGGSISAFQNFVYISASISGGGFPVSSGAWQTTNLGWDALLLKFCGNSCGDNNSITTSFNIPSICNNSPIQFNSVVTPLLTCDNNSYLYKWYFFGATPSGSTQTHPSNIIFPSVGTYTVSLVVDGICMRDSITQIVTVNNCGCAMSITTTNVQPGCGNNNGSATANPIGGSSPYIYLWSNGQTTQTVTGLAVGDYFITVKDAAGCSLSSAVTIVSPSPIMSGQFTKGTANCTGCGCKEWILITATGGTSPYSYSWPDGYDKRYKNHLCPGNYTINIKDKNGCSINVSFSAP